MIHQNSSRDVARILSVASRLPAGLPHTDRRDNPHAQAPGFILDRLAAPSSRQPSAFAAAAPVVPTDIQQPGTQPAEVGNLESPDKCDNCHGGYNTAVEPAFNWRGSMMANAGRDPIFWATVAVAEQDFDGAGDLCIRCHSTGGWLRRALDTDRRQRAWPPATPTASTATPATR